MSAPVYTISTRAIDLVAKIAERVGRQESDYCFKNLRSKLSRSTVA
jgi:hypothetical protein